MNTPQAIGWDRATCEQKAAEARAKAEQPGIGHGERRGWWDMHQRWLDRMPMSVS